MILTGLPLQSSVVSGHQPGYHMYIGVAAKFLASDLFTLADDMDFGRQKFQHRQRFPVGDDRGWLTVPVVKDVKRTSIASKRIAQEVDWESKHLDFVRRSLGKLPYYDTIDRALADVYALDWEFLGDVNTALWKPVAEALDPEVVWDRSSSLPLRGWRGKGARIADELGILAQAGTYVCGSAGDYLLGRDTNGGSRQHVDYIRAEGFSVLSATLDSQLWGNLSPLVVNCSTLEALAMHGPDTGGMIRAATRLEPIGE